MDEKRDSLYQRLINVSNAGLIQSTVVPESRNTSSQSLSISLLDNYVKSRDAYLKLCNIVDIPVALKYPYCFFYSKNGSIFTIDYFSYGTTCKSNKLTGLSQILCKHRNAVQIEQNLFKAEVAQAAAAALFSK